MIPSISLMLDKFFKTLLTNLIICVLILKIKHSEGT